MAATPTFRPAGSPDPDAWRVARRENIDRAEGTARQLFGDVIMVDDSSQWRTAVHESGHTLMALYSKIQFLEVVCSGASGHLDWGRINHALEMPSLATRIAVDVSGALAEHVVFGAVDVDGAAEDCAVALARTRGEDWSVIRCLPAVRSTLFSLRRPLIELASALVVKGGKLSRAECVRVVEAHGMPVAAPLCSARLPNEEADRLRQVRQDLKERRERVQRLRKGARA